MKKIMIICLFGVVGFASFTSCHQISTPFEIYLQNYNTYTQKAKIWEKEAYDYATWYVGFPCSTEGGHNFGIEEAKCERKQRAYEKKAEKVFMQVCKHAYLTKHFDWIFQHLPKIDWPYDSRTVLAKKIANTIFKNPSFKVEEKWVEYRKKALVLEKDLY